MLFASMYCTSASDSSCAKYLESSPKCLAIWVCTVGLHQSPMWARCITTILKIQALSRFHCYSSMLALSFQGTNKWNYRWFFPPNLLFKCIKLHSEMVAQRTNRPITAWQLWGNGKTIPQKKRHITKSGWWLQLWIQLNKTLAKEETTKFTIPGVWEWNLFETTNTEKLHDRMNLFRATRSTEFFCGGTWRHPQHAEVTFWWASCRRKPPTFEQWTPYHGFMGIEHGCRAKPENSS